MTGIIRGLTSGPGAGSPHHEDVVNYIPILLTILCLAALGVQAMVVLGWLAAWMEARNNANCNDDQTE